VKTSLVAENLTIILRGPALSEPAAPVMSAYPLQRHEVRADRQAHGNSRFDVFLVRLKALGTIVFHPLLLEVMSRHKTRLNFSIASESILRGIWFVA
jgi:hypothetical protein